MLALKVLNYYFFVIEEEGDVVVSVTGPRKTFKVRRKEKNWVYG